MLARGLLSGHWSQERALGARDFRAHRPRFTAITSSATWRLVQALRAIAGEKSATAAQIAIAWVLAQGDDILPLIGARRRDRLAEALGRARSRAVRGRPRRIERAVPAGAAAGDRYDARGMMLLDSERSRTGTA